MPAIIQLKDGTYSVLLGVKSEENKALTIRPLAKHPVVHTFDELQEQMNDFVLILAHKLLIMLVGRRIIKKL